MDLIHVLIALFAITLVPESNPITTWPDLKEALETYAQSLSRQRIYDSIRSDTPQNGWTLTANDMSNKFRELLNK